MLDFFVRIWSAFLVYCRRLSSVTDKPMHMPHLKKTDRDIAKLIEREWKRQEDGLEMIPSENMASPAVLEALGSVLANKYSEGYPGARYYGGNEVIDDIETLAQERAKALFGVPYANVQPYSGSPANFAVYLATCEAGDATLGQALFDGGHLSHGWKYHASSKFFKTIGYHVKEDGRIDLEEVERLAKEYRPKLIWVGATAYPRALPFKEFAKIADSVGAYLVADMAHIAGLVAAGVHESPVPYAHIVTTTTHKTLRGPRGGMILVTKRGLKKDPELAVKIDKAIIPGSQGGPHNHQVAATAVALKEADTPAFRRYGKQVVQNAATLAKELMHRGLMLVSGGTDNHLLLIQCGAGRGALVESALDAAGITVNKNSVPQEPSSAFYPSGIRLGTPFITSRGMKAREMKSIARWIAEVFHATEADQLPKEANARKEFLAEFSESVKRHPEIVRVRQEVRELCKKFPMYR